MSLSNRPDPSFHITVSDRVEEAESVARLVHDGFVESGFMEPRPSGRRVTGPYLNPGTRFYACRAGGRDAASGIMVADGPWGLGPDRVFPDLLTDLRAEAPTVVEAGSLTIAPRWRRHRRRIIVLVLACLIRHASQLEPGAQIVHALDPTDTRFWQSVFGVRLLSSEPRPFLGAPAELITWNWEDTITHLRTGSSRLQRELLEAAAEQDPPWLTDRTTGEGLPPSWYLPLVAEDPEVAQLEERLALLRGTAEVHGLAS